MEVFCSIYIFWIDLQSASTTAKNGNSDTAILLIGKINSNTLLQALKFNHMIHLLLKLFETSLSLVPRR